MEGFRPLTVCDALSGFYMINENGEITSKKGGKRLRPKTDRDGYLCLSLCTNELIDEREHKRKMFRIASLVLREFKGEPPQDMSDPTVDHADGNKQNNHFSNLRWMERVQNSATRKRTCPGEINGSAKLTENDVCQIKQLLSQGEMSLREIGNLFGVERSTIFSIKKNKNWKHVASESTGRM